MCIRKAQASDLDQIFELEKQCFQGNLSYSKQQLQYLITRAHSTCFVEEVDSLIQGFIIILYRRRTFTAGIETIDVNPALRRKGIARRLLRAAEEDMKKKKIRKIRLEVSTTNQEAIAFYESEGYTKIALLPKYYIFDHNGSKDAYRMVKLLG